MKKPTGETLSDEGLAYAIALELKERQMLTWDETYQLAIRGRWHPPGEKTRRLLRETLARVAAQTGKFYLGESGVYQNRLTLTVV